jgi:hypothetical protein
MDCICSNSPYVCVGVCVCILCAQVGRQLEVQEQLLHGLEAQLKERERAVSGGRNTWQEVTLRRAVQQLPVQLRVVPSLDCCCVLNRPHQPLVGSHKA